MKRQSGFTLIELIIVIVILGILAVTVAPQFFNFGSDARASTVRALEGSMRAASEMVYARGQIGRDGDGNVEVRDNQPVEMAGDYAVASEAGIGAALQIGNDWDEVDEITQTGTYTLGPAGFDNSDAELPADPTSPNQDDSGCYAYYIWTGPATGEPTMPTIGSVTTDC